MIDDGSDGGNSDGDGNANGSGDVEGVVVEMVTVMMMIVMMMVVAGSWQWLKSSHLKILGNVVNSTPLFLCSAHFTIGSYFAMLIFSCF